MVHRLKLDVGGQLFSITSNALQNGPQSKLTRMYKSWTTVPESPYIEIDRPADMFASIIAMYQTGELHFPMTSCPGAFLHELEFWEISPDLVEDCCLNRLQGFVHEQDTLKKFQESRLASIKHSCYSDQLMRSFQAKLWNIVNYSKPSMYGRLYFMISLSMVLISIVTLALSTDPYFRRRMTNCERLEYMEYSGMAKTNLAKKWLQRDCNTDSLPNYSPPLGMLPPPPGDVNACNQRKPSSHVMIFLPFEYIYNDDNTAVDSGDEDDIFFDENGEGRTKKSGNDSDDITESDVPLNLSSSGQNLSKLPTTPNILSEIPSPQNDTLRTPPPPFENSNTSTRRGMIGEFVELPAFNVRIYAFAVLDTVTVVYFTADVILRLLFCPSRKRYFFNMINFPDLIALIGSYVHIVLMQIYKHEQYRDSWMDSLKYLQVLRSLRLFRIVSNVRAGQVLAYTVRENFKDISILVLFLFVGMSSFASCIFVTEERQDFRSIPVGWYWALLTMTTVGYGDIVPKTAVGRIIGCLCAFAGIILLALTVPIFANNFLTLYNFANSETSVQKFRQKESKLKKPEKTVKGLNNSTFTFAECEYT